MELPGSTYLFNLSLLAITFAAVSVLVMLVRQTMGGKLSKIDVHLVTTFVSLGFVQAISAVLPPAADLFGLSDRVLWAVASGPAALLLAAVFAHIQWERSKLTTERLAPLVVFAFAG
jgi:cytochrome c oxidase subunit IV